MSNKYEIAKYYVEDLKWSMLPFVLIKKKEGIGFEKRPTIKWKNYQTQKPTWEEVKGWLDKNWNLGLITGEINGICVIDDDRVKHSLKAWGFNSTVELKTATGGSHFYYKYRRGITSVSNNSLFIDIKGERSFTALPLLNGYSWIKEPTPELLKNLPEFSISYENLIRADKGRKRLSEISLNEITNITEGGRNESLLRACNSMCNKYPREQWDTVVFDIITGINQTYSPPLDKEEVLTIFNKAKKFVLNNPANKNIYYQNNIYKKTTSNIRTEPVFYSQFSDQQFSNVEKRESLPIGIASIDQKFTFPAGYYVVVGVAGTGKGFFATWLSRVFFIRHNKKSVYFSLEMTEPLIRSRLLQQWSDLTQEEFESGKDHTKAQKIMSKDAIVVYPFGQDDMGYQTPDNFKKDFEDFYIKGYRIFHFDHLHELKGSNSNDTNQAVVELWSKTFQNICKQYPDVWLFVFAQPNGSAGNKNILRRTDIQGSKVITNKSEIFLSLNRKLEKDKSGELTTNQVSRETILWCDKNRIDSNQYFGINLYFSKTGNYEENSFSKLNLDYPEEKDKEFQYFDTSLIEKGQDEDF